VTTRLWAAQPRARDRRTARCAQPLAAGTNGKERCNLVSPAGRARIASGLALVGTPLREVKASMWSVRMYRLTTEHLNLIWINVVIRSMTMCIT
jgi:hypothetical protein